MRYSFDLVGIAAFDPVGIGQTLSIIAVVTLAIVVLVVVAFAWAWFDDDDDYEVDAFGLDEGGPGRGGVLLAQYLGVDDLTSIAAQQNIVPNPAWIERGQTSKAAAEVGAGGTRASGERGRDTREHVEMPRQAVDLLPKLLAKLNDGDMLVTNLAHPPLRNSDVRSVVADVEGATEYALEHLHATYPDGFDDPAGELVREVVAALNRKAHADEIEQKRAEFTAVGQESLALIESVWRVQVNSSRVRLSLAEWEVPPEVEMYMGPQDGTDGNAVPQGIHINVDLDLLGLTRRGARELTRSHETRRLGVFGTTARFDRDAGRLEILPIAVFSRVGRAAGIPRVRHHFGGPGG